MKTKVRHTKFYAMQLKVLIAMLTRKTITKIRNERGQINSDPTEIKKRN